MDLTTLLEQLDEAAAKAAKAKAVLDEAQRAQTEAQIRYAKAVEDAANAHAARVGEVRALQRKVDEAINGTIGSAEDRGGRVR